MNEVGIPPWEGRAGYVTAGSHRVLAFVHEPSDAVQRSTAVLFCAPFGWDEMVSHRARRNWARRLAESGYPVVRFDLPTTGDSEGDPAAPGRVANWLKATRAMVDWVPERTGAPRLAVIGIGLGGLLAWQVLCDGARCDDLVLWGVPANGRSLLREQRAYARMIAVGYASEHRPQERPAGEPEELTGYLLTADTATELEQLTPAKRPLDEPPERVLLLSRDSVPVLDAHREAFARAGREPEMWTTEDFEALYALPPEARSPWATIQRSIDWLAEPEIAAATNGAARPAAPLISAGRVGAGESGPPELAAAELEWAGARVREEAVDIDLGTHRLSGVLTTPVDAPAQVTTFMLSAGALRRTGVNRAWVELARRWAARGVASLRFDQPGIGDSSGDERDYVSNRALYTPEETEVVLGAMAWAADRGLPERFVPVGSCSGAYWALHAALADERVTATMMLTLWAFRWSEELMEARSTAVALGALRSRFWRRLAGGDITLAELMGKLRSVTPARVAGRIVNSPERSEDQAMVASLDALRDRGTKALFIVCNDQPLLTHLCPDGQPDHLKRWPNVTLEHLGSPDNLFRALPLQARVHAYLDRAMDEVLGAPADGLRLPAPQTGSPLP